MIVREFLVKLGLDVNAQSFAKGTVAVDILKSGLNKLIEIGHDLAHRFEETLEAGDKIKKTSQSIGVAAEALQELQYAGGLADLSAEEMSQSIGILSRKMKEAKDGGEGAAKAFKGIEFQKDGKLKKADEVLGSIAEKFHSMPDGAEKTALAMQLFGRAGKQMIPLLNEGPGKLKELREQAHELGLVLDKDAINSSEELNDNFKRLKEVTTGLWRQAIAPLIPAINTLVKRFLEWRKANAAIMAQKLREYIGYVIKGIGMLGDTFEFLVTNATMVKIVLAALVVGFAAVEFASIKAAVAAAAAWAIAMAPFAAIAAVVTAIMLVFDDLRGYKEGEDSLYGTFKDELEDWLKPRDDDPWFVVALKYFVGLMNDAIKVMLEFERIMGRGQNATSNPYVANSNSPQWKKDAVMARGPLSKVDSLKARVSAGEDVPMEELMAGMSEERRMRTPEYLRREPSSSVVNIGAPVVNIGPVTQQPGESTPEFTERIGKVFQDLMQPTLQAAVAGVKK